MTRGDRRTAERRPAGRTAVRQRGERDGSRAASSARMQLSGHVVSDMSEETTAAAGEIAGLGPARRRVARPAGGPAALVGVPRAVIRRAGERAPFVVLSSGAREPRARRPGRVCGSFRGGAGLAPGGVAGASASLNTCLMSHVHGCSECMVSHARPCRGAARRSGAQRVAGRGGAGRGGRAAPQEPYRPARLDSDGSGCDAVRARSLRRIVLASRSLVLSIEDTTGASWVSCVGTIEV